MNADALRSKVFITSQTHQKGPGDVILGHSGKYSSASPLYFS